MFKAKVGLSFDEAAALQRLNLQSGGLVQQTIDKLVIEWNLQYCPWDTGTLAESAYTATQAGSGEVIYPGPYAHYQYYGEVYGPNIPVFEDNSGKPTGFFSPPKQKKHKTGKKLDYHKSQEKQPLAGAFWFERMKADHLNDIVQEAKRVARGK